MSKLYLIFYNYGSCGTADKAPNYNIKMTLLLASGMKKVITVK
jgi:hypothetical protein